MAKLVEVKRHGKAKTGKPKKRYEYSPTELAELKKIGLGISGLIAQTGSSVERFAYETGLGKGHLSRIIRGQANVRYSTLRTIAKGLGIKDVPSLLFKVLDR